MNGFPTVADPVNVSRGPFGWPTRTVTGLYRSNGYPDPLHDTPAVKLLREAVFYIDAANSVAGERCAINQGTGGVALNALYGGNVAAVTTNYPLLLTKRADEPAYLSLPGIANNTIGCTAPANTASYAAYPVGGGAATTGAAVAGAFTLQTAGSWVRVDLLDAGAVVLASFVAADSGQSGYTDAFSVVWTIARHTSGRKTVLVTRPCWLFGTDDYMEIANHPLLEFHGGFTIGVIARRWGTQTSNRVYLSKFSSDGATAGNGWYVGQSTGTRTVRMVVGSGGSTFTLTAGTAGDGALSLIAGRRKPGPTNGEAILGTTAGTTAAAGASTAAIFAMRVGAYASGSGGAFPIDAEILAAFVFRRALTTTEIATINTWYQTS